MGQQYDNTNRGCLFRNKKKQREAQPDYTGKIDIGGVEYFLSGWAKESKAGEKYLSLAVQTEDQRKPQAPKPQAQQPAQPGEHFNADDIPF